MLRAAKISTGKLGEAPRTFLSQIWSGLLPIEYMIERNPDWKVFLNMVSWLWCWFLWLVERHKKIHKNRSWNPAGAQVEPVSKKIGRQALKRLSTATPFCWCVWRRHWRRASERHQRRWGRPLLIYYTFDSIFFFFFWSFTAVVFFKKGPPAAGVLAWFSQNQMKYEVVLHYWCHLI